MIQLRKFICLPLVCAMLAMPTSANAAAVDDARAFVDKFGKSALTTIADQKLTKQAKQKKLEQLFATNVDIPWVGRFVLGRFWRTATDAQKAKYIKEYSGFVTTVYAARFAAYSGGSYKILDARADEEPGEFRVTMEIITPDNKKVQVDYRVHEAESKGLQFFDVVVEGVSMITTQRSEFSSLLSNKGLDYLIEQLANRTLETELAKAKNN